MSALHHIPETQTQRVFGTDQLNAQKAREVPRRHPWPAGQVERLYGIRKQESFLPIMLRPSPSATRNPDLLTVQRHTPPLHVTSGVLTTDDPGASAATAAADVDLLLGSADEPGTLPPPDRTPSTTGGRKMGANTVPASVVLREELAAQLAHIAG
ncbi:hypothetical protein EDB87DRAFT_1306323 [Lactarius vividus]|nr:hypothetical protein EDB87DRAFT_1306323 [Lactarius vividus]